MKVWVSCCGEVLFLASFLEMPFLLFLKKVQNILDWNEKQPYRAFSVKKIAGVGQENVEQVEEMVNNLVCP